MCPVLTIRPDATDISVRRSCETNGTLDVKRVFNWPRNLNFFFNAWSSTSLTIIERMVAVPVTFEFIHYWWPYTILSGTATFREPLFSGVKIPWSYVYILRLIEPISYSGECDVMVHPRKCSFSRMHQLFPSTSYVYITCTKIRNRPD